MPDIKIDRERVEPLLRKSEGAKRNHALLYGPYGTGKTTTAYRAAKPGQEVIVITLTAEESAAALVGHYIPEGDHFVYHKGPVLQAWEKGALLVVNEIDHASEDVSNVLHAILDNPEVAKFNTPSNETVHPAPGFRCIATMNGSVDDLAPAVLDRFSLTVGVWQPSKEMMDALPKPLRAVCRQQYEDARNREDGNPDITYRELSSFGELLGCGIDPEEAAGAALSNKELVPSLLEKVNVFKLATDARDTWKEGQRHGRSGDSFRPLDGSGMGIDRDVADDFSPAAR